jgi:ubiquinone/menaquinone biosynthesis C-methylase UbiE
MRTAPSYLAQLDYYAQVEYDILQSMIAWLCEGQRLRVLDAGCGEGAPALIFAEHGCIVVGVDVDEPSLENANALLKHTAFGERVEFQQADILHLPFEDATFDLVWSSAALHHVADKRTVVHELKRVLKPGGRLAIREGGLPLQLLPFDIGIGEPGLQYRLHLADERWFAAMLRDTLPNNIPYAWAQLLRDESFHSVTARTFAQLLLPPFTDEQKQFITTRLERNLVRDQGGYGPFLNEADRETLTQLLDGTSAQHLLNRSDVQIHYGLSVYVGQKVANDHAA